MQSQNSNTSVYLQNLCISFHATQFLNGLQEIITIPIRLIVLNMYDSFMLLRLLLFYCTGVWWAVNNLVSLGTTLSKIKPFTFTFACGRWSFQRNVHNSKKVKLQSIFSVCTALDSFGLIISLLFLYLPSLHFNAINFMNAFFSLSYPHLTLFSAEPWSESNKLYALFSVSIDF